MKKQVRAAARRFARFTGHDAKRAVSIEIDLPRAALYIGPVLAIEYEAVRDGQTERYRHRFSAHAAPILAASDDGRQLLLLQGRFRFTERGIVDTKK